MKKIIVPTDFSPTAEKAQDFSVQTAKLFDAEVTLLHSFEIEKFMTADYAGYNKDFVIDMVNQIERNLDRAKKYALDLDEVEVQTYLSSYDLNTAIKKLVDEKKADLIVMGTIGQGGIGERLWGTKTSSFIGKTETPVMVIPYNYKWKKPSKILFLTNQFEKDTKILNYIFEWAGLYMANVEIGVFTDVDGDKIEKFFKNKEKLEEYEAFIKAEYYENTIASQHLIGHEFEETLNEYIEENEVDMIVMVTYPRGILGRLFNKSLTKKMSYNTKIPLLAISAKEK